MNTGIWITKDGRAIPIRAMERRHILNCIAKIQNHRSWRREYLERLQLELRIRDHLGESH